MIKFELLIKNICRRRREERGRGGGGEGFLKLKNLQTKI